jgi:hypothetical protein
MEQIALIVYASSRSRLTIGGARLLMASDLMAEIRRELLTRRIEKSAIPEQYIILRSLQFRLLREHEPAKGDRE